MNELVKLMVDERTQQMQSDVIMVIVISLIAAAMLLIATFLILPRFGRNVTVVRKFRETKDGENTMNVECKYKRGDQTHTFFCDSRLLYDGLKVGGKYNVTIKNDHIVKLNKPGDNRWRHKKH